MYITYTEYADLYAPVENFNVLCYEASRQIDRLTTGVDGVKKLKTAFPVDEDATRAVKYCTAKIINFLAQIQEAEQSASLGRGFVQTENGIQGKVISSVSSGNESISYATVSSQKSAIDTALTDASAKDSMIRSMIREYLSGVTDVNGVNLLYMGRYPRV